MKQRPKATPGSWREYRNQFGSYYPFGLTMTGISSKTLKAGYSENRKQFNGIEHTTDLDLNQYDAFYRGFDPQIGRFLQIDPKTDSMYSWSPYAAMFDNPIRFLDPLGDSSKPQQGYTPAPKTLPGFPDAGKREFNKESTRYRWKLKDGTILEWDKQHGEVEKYDKSGKNHQGSFDPNTGEQIKDPVAGRTTPKIVSETLNSDTKPSGRPWWSPIEPQFDPISGSGSPETVTGQKAALDNLAKSAAAVGAGYLILKVIEFTITVGTGGAAAPILIL